MSEIINAYPKRAIRRVLEYDGMFPLDFLGDDAKVQKGRYNGECVIKWGTRRSVHVSIGQYVIREGDDFEVMGRSVFERDYRKVER